MSQEIKNVVFDLGGVLVDWNPRNLYRKIFSDPIEMEEFLRQVCTTSWNEEQDAGRPFQQATEQLALAHPHYRMQIQAFDERWDEMIAGALEDTVDLLKELHALATYRLFALSNWSQEKFPVAEKMFPFLELFEGLVVSGRIGIKKPDPRIFIYLCDQFEIVPAETVFIDDVAANVSAAERLGFIGVHFESAAQLRARLVSLRVL